MRKFIINLAYNVKYKNYKSLFGNIKKNVYKNFDELSTQQNEALKKMIKYSFEKVPYYRQLSQEMEITVNDIQTINDLSKLPILDKNTVKSMNNKFYSDERRKFSYSSTGGSTGIPLKYRLDKECLMYGRAINDRGWGYAGYKPGDNIVIFAGGSLVNTVNLRKKIINLLSNKTTFSSYGVDENKFHEIYCYLQKKDPKYMYCYASSIYFFALYLEKNNLKLKNPPKAIFTTSEKLFSYQRKKVNEIIGEVFDDYGMNDGGVSAHECECHNGLHIDFERSILEVVDENGIPMKEGKGKVIATDLRNYAMPLIRYDTGDLAVITHQPCECGRTTPRLMEIVGRTTDYLKIGDTYIGSPALTVLMGKLDIVLYQIIQDKQDHVIFKLVLHKNSDRNYKNICAKYIKASMYDKVPNANIDFEFYDSIDKLGIKNKHKFIINETLKNNYKK